MTEKLEAGKVGTPAAAPSEAAKPRNRWFGVKNGLAMAVGVASVAALIFARSGCGPEGGQDRPAPAPAPPAPDIVQQECPAPMPNVCNLSLGEHDYQSPNWAPEKCGYCGDNIQQQWETPDNCPVDFHCGDGQVNRGAVYGAVVAPVPPGTSYSLGTVTVTESCNPSDTAFCEADCPTPRGQTPAPASSDRRRDRRRDTAGPAATTTARPPVASSQCEAEITGRLQNRVSSSLLGSAASARSAAGADGQTVRARVSISISNGVPTVTGISLSCPGCSGGALSPSSVNVAGIPLDRSATCTTSITVNIPPG